jgi:hypothetical protein
VAVATNGAGVVVGRLAGTVTFTTYNQAGAAIPGNNVTSVAFDQGSSATTNLRAVVGTTAGGARAQNLQGTATWSQYTTTTTPNLPSNAVNDCAYFGGVTSGNYYMFATNGGVAFTTDGWSTRTVYNRTSPVIYLPRVEASACAYYDGNTTGDRMLIGSPAATWDATGGLVLRAGTTYFAAGSLVIPNLDGQLLPTSSVNIASLPDRNIRGISYFDGDGNNTRFVVATDYGAGLTTDGGLSFTPLREPNTPAANQLPTNVINCIAYARGNNQVILVGTNLGAALTTNGGTTWTRYNTGTTPALPSNTVRWVAFHDGIAAANVYIIVTAAGSLYVNGATTRTITNTSGISATTQYGADFLDSDADGTHTFLIACCAAGNNGGGACLTTNDGVAFTRYFNGTPASFAWSTVNAVAWFNGTTWFAAKWPELSGFNGDGNLQRTVDSAANFVTFDQAQGLVENDIRWFAICQRTANPTHWMVAGANNTGISYTSNGNLAPGTVTFTNLTATSTPALPSNNVLSCTYWNGTGASGQTWAVGTSAGMKQTTNGGANLATLRKTCLGYLRIDVQETLNGQTLTYDLLNSAGSPIGGWQGLTPAGGSIDLSTLNYATYPSIRVRVNFSTSNPSLTPVLNDIRIVYRY